MVFTLLVAFYACGNTPEQKVEEPAPQATTAPAPMTDTALAATITELLKEPVKFENKEVRIEGVISHVCRRAGDKMRILQDGSDLTIEVKLGDFTGKITPDSEGMRVVVTGILKTEASGTGETEEHHEAHEGTQGESEKAAEAAMKAEGIDTAIKTYILLKTYEFNQPA